jgi:3-dehydroquinate dehydratase-2
MKQLHSNKILILNGPNLNMLGVREPSLYGIHTLKDIESLCRTTAKEHGYKIDFKQSNYEGDLVTWIQKARGKFAAVIINAAGYTHTSVVIHDALKLLDCPIIEVHLTDPETREPFRHFSYITPVAAKVIKGKGAQGYIEAIASLSALVNAA